MTDPRPTPPPSFVPNHRDFTINGNKPFRSRQQQIDLDVMEDLSVEETVTEDEEATDRALVAETEATPRERPDQMQANMLAGRLVRMVDHPEQQGVVTSWKRFRISGPDSQIYLNVETDGKEWNCWLYDVELVPDDDPRERADPGYLEDEAAETMTDDEIDAAMHDFPGEEEHGSAVLVSFSSPEGEPLGSHITYKDGTHQPVEPADPSLSLNIPPADYHDEIADPPKADHVNVVPPIPAKEIKKQATKGTEKLKAASKEFERWKKQELPDLIKQIDVGYSLSHRMFLGLTDDQLDIIIAKRPAVKGDRWMVNSQYIKRVPTTSNTVED